MCIICPILYTLGPFGRPALLCCNTGCNKKLGHKYTRQSGVKIGQVEFFYELSHQLKRRIQKHKKIFFFNSYLRDLDNDYTLQKETRKLKRPITQIPLIRIDEGSLAANKRCTFLQPNESDIISDLEKTLIRQEEIKLVTSKEVIKEIKININPIKSSRISLQEKY